MPIPDTSSIETALALSLLNWLGVLLVFSLFRTTKQGRIHIPVSNTVLFVYAFNFILTYYLDIGVVGSEKSKLGFLLTIIPIGYLIFVNGQSEKLGLRFYFSALLFILTDLVRSLLEAVLKVGYVLFLRIKTIKKISIAILVSPLLIYISSQLIEYKLNARGVDSSIIDHLQVQDVITSRISNISTIAYGLSYSQPLSKVYISEEYGTPWKSAFLVVIPKGIFGIVPPRTWNNALIEFYLGRVVPNSSVNSPLILNLYLLSIGSLYKLVSYLVFVSIFLYTTLKLANNLLGVYGEPFKFYIIFQFFWTGNTSHLVLPLYFLLLLYIIQNHTKVFTEDECAEKA